MDFLERSLQRYAKNAAAGHSAFPASSTVGAPALPSELTALLKAMSGGGSDYFKQTGVDENLARIIADLGKEQPADPFKFLAEKLQALPPPAAPAKAASPAKTATPAPKPAAAPAAAGGANDAEVTAVGDQIRALKEKLKGEGLSGGKINGHAEVKALVAKLTELKQAGAAAPAAPPVSSAPPAAADVETKAKAAPKGGKKEAKPKADGKVQAKASSKPSKGGGIDVKKAEDSPEWYAQVIKKAELIEDYPVKGCFTLRPWAYSMWEVIMGFFDGEIKKLGVENAYFPMFIPKEYIGKEEAHLDDFAAELAWVTKFGANDIEEPVALRPTSETAMYAAYANWVQSYRDLPIKINQWCNMIRWEVKQTTPFLRMRENLWQEGHTAYAERPPAEAEVLQILELYARVYEELLAMPVVRGKKTKAETFPGADYTTTVEAYIGATGRAIQGATSHHLGQRFSKMFDISFQDPKDTTGKIREFAFQNSWGITTRTIGVMIMVHGDDRGLVMAPGVASLQVVIVPVGLKAASEEGEKEKLSKACETMVKDFKAAGIRVKLDDGDQKSPGNKFNYWEMKGVPLRIEVGPADLEKGQFMMAKRNVEPTKDSKLVGKLADAVAEVQRTLAAITKELYAKATAERDACFASIDDWKEVTPNLNKKRLLLVPFCGEPDCEEEMKEKTKAEAADEEEAGGLKMGMKSLCIPFEDKYNKNCPSKCINPDCKHNFQDGPKRRVLFGRSY